MNGEQPPSIFGRINDLIEGVTRPIGKPLGQAYGVLGGGIANLVAPSRADMWREQFTRAGEATPRFLAEAAMYGAKRTPLKALGLADVALRTSQQPGADVASTLANTAAFATAPAVGSAASRMVEPLAERVGQQFTSQGGRYLAGEAGRRVGSMAGGLAPFTAAEALDLYRHGQPLSELLSPENIIGTAASVLPFEAMHLPRIAREFKQATKPLVNTLPVSDQSEVYNVHYNLHDEDKVKQFTGLDSANQFRDELRKVTGVNPIVEAAGTMPRSYVTHQMAWSPKDLQGGLFGLKTQEVLNEMGEKEMPGPQMLGTLRNRVPKSEWEALPGFEDFLTGGGPVKQTIGSGPIAVKVGDTVYAGQGTHAMLAEKYKLLGQDVVPGFMDRQGKFTTGPSEMKRKVTPQQVKEWLDANAPRVEIKKMSSFGQSPLGREYSELTHNFFDRLSSAQKNLIIDFRNNAIHEDDLKNHFTEDQVKQAIRFKEIQPMLSIDDVTAQHAEVSPKPESAMKDYVEGAVVVPLRQGQHGPGTTIETWRREARELFPSSHSFPPNTLGWFRGYMETDAQGKKTFHIIEVQSDWAKHIQRLLKRAEDYPIRGQEQAEVDAINKSNHPLLPQWERLTLKAAIDHAIKNGADRIAVSDAETAIMTEGHDRSNATHIFENEKDARDFASRYVNSLIQPFTDLRTKETNWSVNIQTPEEPGMRLHYDNNYFITDKEGNFLGKESFPDAASAHSFAKNRTAGLGLREGTYEVHKGLLNEILRELTGEKGEKVSFGEHKMAFTTDTTTQMPPEARAAAGPEQRFPRPNLIFREPTGEPKTSVTAQSYDLTKAKSELSKRGGFPMFGGEKFVKSHVERMMAEGYEPEEIVRAIDNVKLLPARPGETPFQTLARSVGVDPKLFSDLPASQALPKALEFLTSMFHYNYGQPVERAAYLARQVALPLARFAPWLKNTQFAVSGRDETGSRITGMKEPGSEVFKFLAKIYNYPGTRYTSLESQVFEVARALGHETGHKVVFDAMNPISGADPKDTRAVIRSLVSVEAIPPDLLAPIMVQALKRVVPANRWGEISKVNFSNYQNSPEEFLADFAGVLALGSTRAESVKNMQDAVTFGDRASQEFSKAIYRDLTSVWSGTRDWIKEFGLPGHETKRVAKLVDEVYNNLTKLMQTSEQAERTLDTFEGFMDRLQSGPLDPPPVVTYAQTRAMLSKLDDLDKQFGTKHMDAAQQVVEDAVRETRPYELSEKVAGERLSFWRDFFKPMSQLVESLKEKVQSAIPVKALAFSYRSVVSTSQQATWDIWKNQAGKIDWKRLRWLGRVDGTPQERAFTKLSLIENVRTVKENAEEPLSREDREKLSSEYKVLSPEDKERIDMSLDQAWGMVNKINRHQWDAHRDRIAWQISKIVMSYNKDLYHDKAKAIADEAVRLVFDEPRDVEQMPAFTAERDRFFSSLPLPDKGKTDLYDAVQSNLEPWQKLGDRLLGQEDPNTGERPGRRYLPEVRVREWHVVWQKEGEELPGHESFKTEAQAAKKISDLREQEGLSWIKSYNRKDKTERFRGAVQEEITSAQQDALDALKESVLSRISAEHPEAKDIIKQIDEEFQPATAFQEVTVSPYMREREFLPGRESLNMMEGVVRYIDAASYQMAKRHVKQAGQVVLFNPDMRENPNIRNNFEKYLRFVTDAEGKEFNMMKNLTFFNYMFLNPVQILIEPSQQLLTMVPYLVENGMGIGDAYKSMVQANKDIAKSYVNQGRLENPREEQALGEAIIKRTVDTGFVSDLYGETDLDFAIERSSFAGNDKLEDMADLVRRPLYQLLALGRHVYGKSTPAINGKVAFLTSFRYEWNRSHNYEKAVSFATQATDATMFGGGKAARPMVLQRFGSASGVGGLMYTLGSYTFNSIAMMGRLGVNAIAKSTLKPNEKVAARKAFGLMLGTQLALGGALGLPLVAAGIAVLEQLFPGLDVRKGVREAFVNLAGDDEDMGHMVADGALRGLGNALTPTDIGSRFQLANLLGVSPYDGFSWANLMGPAANMLGNYVKAIGQASTGEFGQAARTAAPSSIKQILQLVHDDWAVRDKAGRLISEMTPAEKTLAALGFKPKTLTNYYEEQSIRQRTEANQARKVRDIRSDAAKSLADGDVSGARSRILQGTQEAGQYDPIDMAREAAQLAVEMQSPVSRRHGTRAISQTEAEISRLYPQSVGISEVQRVLRQAQLVQQMGMQFGRPSLEQLRTASVVDSLMKQNPKLTIEQARLLAEKQTSPSARRRSSISALLQAPQ